MTTHQTPEEWAAEQNRLGLDLLDDQSQTRGESLEQAISHFQQALTVRTREVAPADWAHTTNNLGIAYYYRIKGERRENQEQAIALYQQALTVHRPDTFPAGWAATTNNLARAYSDRIKGERKENLEQAIALYQQALTVYTQDAFPADWAQITNNLALAYFFRIKGERKENLEQAIALYQQALTVRTQDTFPAEWADTTHHLALAYSNRIKEEQRENIEQAIALYEQALTIYTQEDFPVKWANTTENLAGAYYSRIKGEWRANLEQAITLNKQALTVFTRENFPAQWAESTYNLALIYWRRRIGNSAQKIKPALDCFRQSRSVITPQSFPYKCRWQAYRFGQRLYKVKRIPEARYAFALAHEALEVLRTEVTHWRSKQALATENVVLYEKLVFCCLYEGEIEAAFEYAMAGKGRAFVDLLATTGLDWPDVRQAEPQLAQALQEYERLRQEINAHKAAWVGAHAKSGHSEGAEEESRSNRAQLRTRLDELHQQADEYWQQISHEYPILMATSSEPALSAPEARQLAARIGGTLVEYFRHVAGWSAFVVTADEIKHVPLRVIDKTRWESDQFVARLHGIEHREFFLMADEKELQAEADKWLNSIHRPTFRTPLSLEFLSRLHERFIAPVEASGLLSEDQPVVLAPFGWLHVCPLWAARSRKTGRYIAESYQLSYMPSLTALYVSMARAKKSTQAPPLTAAKPPEPAFLGAAYAGPPESEYYLPHVYDETQTIATLFPNSSVLYEDNATPQALIHHAKHKQIVHLGCHGHFDAGHPQESGLMLAEGWLTVQQIIRSWPWRTETTDSRRLITVAACFGARAEVKRGEDYMGLMQALLTAGAQTVVAGLWAVDDEATRFLFEPFYTQLKAGLSPAQALQQATAFVRSHKRWQHPYYWAAFQVCGAPAPTTIDQEAWSAELIARAQKAQESNTRGMNMNKSTLLTEVEDRLAQLTSYSKAAVKELSYAEWKELEHGLKELIAQAEWVRSEAELLTLVHDILLLFEGIESWRPLVFPNEYNVEQEKKSRSIFIEDHDLTGQMDDVAQEQLTHLTNQLRTFSKNLDRMLPPAPPDDNDPRPLPPPAERGLWERMKGWLGWN